MAIRNHNFIKLQASFLQFIFGQFTTVFLFFITSKYLSKESFAVFNWLTALFVVISSFLSWGVEQIIIKSVAEQKSAKTTRVYIAHLYLASAVLLTGIAIYHFVQHRFTALYFLFAIWSLGSLFSVALKNSITGFELFSKLSRISLISSLVKFVGTLLFVFLPIKTIETVVIIITAGFATDAFMAVLVLRRETDWKVVVWNRHDYLRLLRTAFPQLIVVLSGLALARFDWIYIGLAAPPEVTADYTFAYKMFEFAKLPLLVVSPILLPLFTRIFAGQSENTEQYRTNLKQLYSAEIFVAGLLPIGFACFWNPVLDTLFAGKYGVSNYSIFFILSLAVPLQYSSDYYWNLTFSQNKYRLNMWISVVAAFVNIVLVMTLTPLFGAIGTALAFLISCLLTFLIYYLTQTRSLFKINILRLCIIYLLILISFGIIYLTNHNLVVAFLIPMVYIAVLLKSKFIELNKLKAIFLK